MLGEVRCQYSSSLGVSQVGLGKRILLGMPQRLFFSEIKQQLEAYGFEVIGIPYPDDFKYSSFGDRLYNCFRKVFLFDNKYKTYLKYRDTGAKTRSIIKNILKPVDYALIISMDYFPDDALKLIKEKSKVLIGYQWDGLDRYPLARDLISLFDRFFVFDPKDLKEEGILPTTNFYLPTKLVNVTADIDVYYIGSFVKSRMKVINELAHYLDGTGARSVIKVFSKKPEIIDKYKDSPLEIIEEYISYEQNLAYVSRSRTIVDILNKVHCGLSFRVFEALGNDKKLITDNQNIANYDFYDPSNIFIIRDLNFEGLEEFIASPYKPLDPLIKEKYSFGNWIKHILGIQPHIPISLPDLNSSSV